MIWDNFSIFRTNCAIMTTYIRADAGTCRDSRVDVVTLYDQMVRVARFLCEFFTAMAWNKAGTKSQSTVWRVCKCFGKESLTRTSSSFA